MKNNYTKIFCAVVIMGALSLNAGANTQGNSFKPGDLSAPNSVPIRQGGINADELAANSDALNFQLTSAIAAGNVDGVRQALKAGASLQFDYKSVCSSLSGKTYIGAANSQHDSVNTMMILTSQSGKDVDITSNRAVGGADIYRIENYKESKDKTINSQFINIPTFCYKAHMALAIFSLDQNLVVFNHKKLHLSNMEHLEAIGFSDRQLESFKEKSERQLNRVKIIEILDANIPLAQKRWYGAYALMAKNMTLKRWLFDKYEAANKEIEKENVFDEQNHLGWDKMITARYITSTAEQKGLLSHNNALAIAKFGLFDKNSIKAIDPSYNYEELVKALYIIEVFTNAEENENPNFQFHKMYCTSANIQEKKAQHAEDIAARRAEREAKRPARATTNNKPRVNKIADKYTEAMNLTVSLSDRYLRDSTELYDKEIMDKRLNLNELVDILKNDKSLSLNDKYKIYSNAVYKKEVQREFTKIINEPDTPKLINSDYFHPFSIKLMTKNNSAPLVRALLSIGYDSKRLYANQRSAADIVMGEGADHHKAPYLDADYKDLDCKSFVN